MEQLFETGLLLDFYGQLITKRQYEILDFYCNNDYSLGEIAEQLNISRQGVHDNIRRGKALLLEYEQKLGLVERFSRQKAKAAQILAWLKEIDEEHLPEEERIKLASAVSGTQDLMEGL